jgi:hypothetical protein
MYQYGENEGETSAQFLLQLSKAEAEYLAAALMQQRSYHSWQMRRQIYLATLGEGGNLRLCAIERIKIG